MKHRERVWIMALLLVLCACGKKGPPMPDYSDRLFSWQNVFAVMTDDGCIGVSGTVEGAARNLAEIVLELQPLGSSEDCATCPFMPADFHRVSAADAVESPDGRTFRFTYCPSSAVPFATDGHSWRWRVAGRNVFYGLPPVLTPVRLVQSPPAPHTPEIPEQNPVEYPIPHEEATP